MRIAQITSVYLPVPPPSHGGTEWIVERLCRGLSRRGHEVTLFASGDSRPGVPVESVVEKATLLDPDSTVYLEKELEARNSWNLYRQAGRFDLVHAHWPSLAPYFSGCAPLPTVLTYAYIEPHLHRFYRQSCPNVHPVCISRRQREILGEPDLPVVHNGIPVEEVPFRREPGEGLVFLGRMTPEKGAGDAVRIARALGERLLLIGDVTPHLPWSEPYFRAEVAPFVNGERVRHVRRLPNREVLEALSRARALLFPIRWEEPFGLAVVEAMAAGTPVLTLRRGAMPELVEDGVTGFVRESPEELVEAARRVGELDRAACRRRVEERFSVERMLDGYEEVYRRVVGCG